jgi:biopolymer transport protein ExbD
MTRRGGYQPVSDAVPNLAPMVDVIMVILVFFMLGASIQLAHEGVLQTELDPRSGPGPGAQIEIIPAVKIGLAEVDEGRACNIFINGEPLPGNTFEELSQFMKSRAAAGADTTNPVVVGAQPGVHWRFVLRAMDAAVHAGFKNVQFAVSLGGTDWHRRAGVPTN